MASRLLRAGGLAGCCAVLIVSCLLQRSRGLSLPFLELNPSLAHSLPRGDNVYSEPINISMETGLPYSNETESLIFVSVNGFLSFRTGRDYCCPKVFDSGSPYTHILAPYWSNNDITVSGEVVYEVHTSGGVLAEVSSVVEAEEGVEFEGVWMIVVHWNNVPTHDDQTQTNTHQAVVITDGARSYALFLYRCGWLRSGGAGIGYSASGNFFQNHRRSVAGSSAEVACESSDWSTILYPIHYEGVRAVIVSTPEGPVFHAAQYIDLHCHVITPGAYVFSWEVYCREGGSSELVSSYGNFTNSSTAVLGVRSTPDECLNQVVCQAWDDGDTHTHHTFTNDNVTGVGMFHSYNTFANNTGLQADSAHQLGVISCHSASRQPLIGRWTTPSGDVIPLTGNEIFSIEYRHGNFPSYTVLSLKPGAVFSSSHEGVFSCIIPDENGVEQTVNFALYDNDYTATFPNGHPISIKRLSHSPFTLSCSTSHLPPSIIQWWREDQPITEGDDGFSLSSTVTDRHLTLYQNTLTEDTEDEVSGVIYLCGVRMLVQPYHPIQTPPPLGYTFFSRAVVHDVGSGWSITCSIPDGIVTTSVSWWTQGSEVTRAEGGNSVNLTLGVVSDSHHEEEYICYGLNDNTVVYTIYITVIVQVPASALSVGVVSPPSAQLGQPFTLSCLATKTLDGLTNQTTADWSHDSAGDVTDGPMVRGQMSTSRDLIFPPLRTSHAGRYECTGSLSSRALDQPLSLSVSHALELTIPMATVILATPTSASTFHVGSELTLTCTATLPETVDSEVTGVVTWDTPSGLSTDRITLSSLQTGNHTHQFTLNISSLSHDSDEGDYGCWVVFLPSSLSLYLHPSPQSDPSNTLHIAIIQPPSSSSSSTSVEPSPQPSLTPAASTPSHTHPTLNPAPSAGGGEVILAATVSSSLTVILVVVMMAVSVCCCLRHRSSNDTASYSVTKSYPLPCYEVPPPPYTTTPFTPITNGTTTHTNHLHIHDNGHVHYSVVGNGNHVPVSNCAYGLIPPPLPPARNSTLSDPDLILPYADSGTGTGPDTCKTEGQSSHRIDTANPLYASTETLEPVYTKISDLEPGPHQS